MARFVPDSKTQRWVIISPTRTARPDETNGDKPKKKSSCVFCYGSEHLTPQEVFRIGDGEPDKSGWKVRVVPNKFPITDIHEVIIHSPNCKKDFEDLSSNHVELIIQTYRQRYQAHQNEGHVLIFCNRGGSAGASLKHPHSQLVVVPKQINLDILGREPVKNVIEEGKSFVTYCPDFSQWPYEAWIAPRDGHEKTFGEINDDELKELAAILKMTLMRLSKKYKQPQTQKIHQDEPLTYNFYIFHGINWYFRIIPRLVHRAGFELGTGLNVNIVDPIEAAKELKNISV